MTRRPLVYIVILCYDSEKWIEACLTSVLATDYPNFKVAVIDNGSADNTVTEIRKYIPRVELILNRKNLGFVGGNNVGIEQALRQQADYIALLNPDTRVTPGWLAAMIDVGEAESNIGILGAVQHSYYDGTFNSWTKVALADQLTGLTMPLAQPAWLPVEWVEGSCLIAKREIFQRVGLLDPIYISFYEEIDLCRRAACQGYQTAVVFNSRVHHYRGGSWEEGQSRRRMRNYLCDRGQFIYALTDPRRTFPSNMKWYFITLLTKLKEVLQYLDWVRLWRLLVIQADLLSNWPGIYQKWRRERQSVTF